MATLPDLPTSQAGFVAYHNGLDNGASDVEPTNMLEIGSLGTYQQYDNGIRATYEINRTPAPNFFVDVRVKTDGWVVVWLDAEEQFYGLNIDSASDVKTNSGDFFYDWGGNEENLPSNTNYSIAMKEVSQAVFTGVNYSYSVDDVSLYHYNYTNATATNIVSFVFNNGSFSYPDTIDRKAEVVNASGGDTYDRNILFEGSEFASPGNITTVDMIEQGLTPESGTNYSVTPSYKCSFIITGLFSQ